MKTTLMMKMNNRSPIASAISIKKQLTLFYTMLIMLCFLNTVYAANIRVSVSKNPVTIDESFQIIFTADDQPDDSPDFSALERDFTVLNQQHSSQSSWVNGTASKTIRWIVTVMAKKTGSLSVPAITFGADITDPVIVNVSQTNSANTPQQNSPLFLEVSVNSEQPYIQSQVIYTLRLYTRVQIAQAQLNEPELQDAVISKLDEDKTFIEHIDGVEYSVTERKYAIFPQKSGKQTIKPLTLTAEVLTSSGANFNDFFNTTHTKRVNSKELELDVKPAPKTFTDTHWLAAEDLKIEQEWSGDVSQMKVGEPLTRTLTITAKAATVGSLPELHQQLDDSLKTYPDQPVLNEQKTEQSITAIRQEKTALIPAKEGQFVLPEIKIAWFNTKTNKTEIASVPATTIQVQANANTAEPVTVNQPQTPEPVTTTATEQDISNWFWVSMVLLALWLLTLFYLFTRSPKQARVINIDSETKHTEAKQSIQLLKKACAENNATAAKNALLTWAKLHYGVNNLNVIANNADVALQQELIRLNQALYSKTQQTWQGNSLFQAFIEHKTKTTTTHLKKHGLEPLHRL